MPSPRHSAERWFLLAGEGAYGGTTGLPALEHVPREIATMRAALSELGLTEIDPPAPGARERGLHEVPQALGKWLKAQRSGDDGAHRTLSVLVYCTGHGISGRGEQRWGFALPDHEEYKRSVLTPFEIADPLLGSAEKRIRSVDELLLVLDACYAEKGLAEGFHDIAKIVDIERRTEFDTWVVAAARSYQEAQQLAFARAFKEALSRHEDDGEEFVDPGRLVASVNGLLGGGEQHVWGGGSAGRRCRVLPNPAHMPEQPVELGRGWGEWSKRARGLAPDSRDPGWFFSGRESELAELRDYLGGTQDPGPLVLRGVAGAGKSALLAHVAATGISAWRGNIPAIVRRRGLPVPEGSAHAIVSADGTTLESLTRRIGTALGVELPRGVAFDDLLDCLLDGIELLPPQGILVDDVHKAFADPAELVTELLEPLTEHAKSRIVVAASPLESADAAWRRSKLPILRLEADPEAVRTYVGRQMHHGARSRYRGRHGHPRQERDEVAAACQGNFAAAVAAVDAFLPASGDLRSARRAAAERLRRTYLDALTADGRPQAWAQGMLRPLAAAAACGSAEGTEGSGLTAEHWAALARAMSPRAPVTGPEDAAAAVALLDTGITALDAESGTARYRLALPAEPGYEAGELAEAALRCLEGDDGRIDWPRADAALIALFADAARHEPQRYASVFAIPSFWLALPAATTALFVGARELPVPDGLRSALRSLPPRARRGARAFRLKTQLMRAEADGTPLDIRSFGAPAEVLWAEPEDEPPLPHLLATAEDERHGYALTAHTDGSLRLWESAGGEMRAVLEPARIGGHISSIALAIVDGEPVAVASTADGGLLWRPTGQAAGVVELLGTLLPRTPFDLHADGLLAVARDAVVTVTDVRRPGHVTGSVRFTKPVTRLFLGDDAGGVRLVAATSSGLVTSRTLAPAGSPEPHAPPLILPHEQLALSPSGRTVAALDHSGQLRVSETGRTRGRTLTWPAQDGTLCLAAGDAMCATAGGGRNPWLRLYPLNHAPGRPYWLPLLDPPVGLAFSRDGQRLIVADGRGLMCLDVRGGAEEAPSDHTLESP